MISGIEGHKFKGFRHLILRGPGPFPLLVGANGSGESMLFKVL